MSYTPVEPLMLTETVLLRGVRVTVGAAGWVQPRKSVLAPVSVVQGMPCRLNAANRAAECGVPLFRLPSSSSTARIVFHSEPVLQPFEVQVPLAVQVKALV